MENIEELFYNDCKEKKKIVTNIKHRKNKVISKSIKFPSDYLNKNQIKQLNGEIKVSNIYENIQSWDEILNLEPANRLRAVEVLVKKYGGRSKLAKHFNIKTQSIHDLYYRSKNNNENSKQRNKTNSKITIFWC